MRERNFYKKILGSCLLVLCMAFAIAFVQMPTKADGGEGIKTVPISDYSADGLKELREEQEVAGYLYAGLYKSGTTVDNLTKENVVASPQIGESYEAKFVTAEVMGIMAQVSDSLLKNESLATSSIRMVTAIDSLVYKEVGFSITRTNENGEVIKLVKEGTISKYVYTKLYGVDVTADNPGEPLEYTPQEIHPSANYFKTYTITGVPSDYYNADLTVVPYWKTYDGQTVEGTTGIKTVNLGRSWVYINTSVHTDGMKYGTYDHPYTELADALDAIVLDKNGKIIIQNNCTISPAKNFAWDQRGKDLTITGESGQTETLSFSNNTHLVIGDSVTFENMTLTFAASNVYASGNRFKIAENVASENSNTVILGGSNGGSVPSTDITILAGKYKAIYGGCLSGTVNGDTHITIKNADVYNNSTNVSRVCGGGRKGTVKGNAYVTVGQGFNEGLGYNYTSHSKLSVVSGGGYGGTDAIAIVEGNTKVVIEGGAKANYVYGAGYQYSEVKGTSRVEFKNGSAFSVYGGAAQYATNSHTSVVMTDGTVTQVLGGSEYSPAGGNTNVQILGGTVTRRIYGGCYNGTNDSDTDWLDTNYYANGYSSITIGKDANLSFSYLGGDKSFCAVSRNKQNNEDEIGVMVLNPGVYDTYKDRLGFKSMGLLSLPSLYTNYLVTVSGDGSVTSENGVLQMKPNDSTLYATVTHVTNNEEVLCRMQGQGTYELPEPTDRNGVQEIKVTFSSDAPDLSQYEASVDNGVGGKVYYSTLEEAIAVAAERTDKPVVTLLTNVTLNSTLTITDSTDITIQSETGNRYTITDSSADSNLLEVEGTLALANLDLESGKSGIYMKAGSDVTATDVNVTRQSASESSDTLAEPLIYISENSIFTLNGDDVYTEEGELSRDGSTIDGASILGRGVYVDGTFILNGGTIKNNSTTENGGGVYVSETGKLDMQGGAIQSNAATQNGGGIYIESQSRDDFTNNIRGGTIQSNTATQNGGGIYINTNKDVTIQGVTIQNNTATQNGGGVYVYSARAFNMESGTIITGNSAVDGGGVYTDNKGIFTMNNGTITANTATEKGSGVCVTATNGNKPFTMKGGTISNHGDPNSRSTSAGTGVYVAEGAKFIMEKESVIEENYSKNDGAGVAVAGTFTLTSGTIQDNDTTHYGAGVYISSTGTFIMNNGKIYSNTASSLDGGGIYQEGSVTINAGEISENYSNRFGAGIYMVKGTTITIKDGKILDNETNNQNGAAIYAIENNIINLTGYGEISGNDAGKANVPGVFVQNAKEGSQVTLYTTFIMGNEIRYNTLSSRGTDNPILIIKGSISDSDDYALNLGFHKDADVYIECDDANSAAAICKKITLFKTLNCVLSNTSDSKYITVDVKP